MTSLLLAGALSGSGCLRFAYNDVDRLHGKSKDAGMDGAAGPADAGGVLDASQLSAAARGGSAGAAGSAGSGGRTQPQAGSAAGQSGAAAGQGGDVALDAGMLDASAMDGSTSLDSGASVADSGGTAVTDSGSSSQGPVDVCAGRTDLLYCNGFDKDPYDGIEYYLVSDNAVGELSTSIKYSGAGALHAYTISAAKGTQSRFATRALNKQKSGDVWSRFYYYLPSTTQINTFFSCGVASELSDPFSGFDLQVYSDHVRLESWLGYSADGPAFPRDRWVCVELHAYVHTSQGYLEAFIDGAQVARYGNGNTVPAGGFTAAEFGIHYAEENQLAMEVYVDEAMVDTVRVPCNP